MAIKYTRLLNRRKTAAQWQISNEILMDGEIGVVTDSNPRLTKIGDGVTPWNSLLYSGVDPQSLEEAKKRSNHTGTQLASTISDFVSAVMASVASGLSSVSGTPVVSDNIITILSKFKNFYDNIGVTVRSTVLSGVAFGLNTAISASDTVLVALGKIQGQLNSRAVAADIAAGTDLLKIPTAKSLADIYDNNIETVISGSGVMINQATPTSTLRFTTTAAQVIISGMAGSRDGKTVVIVNDTAFALSLLHDNQGAAVGNRLYIQGLNNVNIGVGGAVVFRYSVSKAGWVMIDLWGTDYFPTLIGPTTRAMEVTPGGYAQASEMVELKEWDDAQTVAFTKATLNSKYPLFKRGQQVVCPNIAGGAIIYEKFNDSTNDWLTFGPLAKLA